MVYIGRRKSAEKIERQKQSYLGARKRLEGRKREVDLSVQEFSDLVYPLRTAVKRVGLKLTSGKILRKNNRGGCSILFFPQCAELYPLDNGAFRPCWENVAIVRAIYHRQPVGYGIKLLDQVDRIENGELYSLCAGYSEEMEEEILGKEEFARLIAEYVLALNELTIAEIPSMIEFALPRFRNGKFSNFTPIYKKFFEEDFDNEWKVQKDSKSRKAFLAKDIESLLFSATLFSLCKPLFKMCKIKDAHIEFAVQFLIKPDIDNDLEMESEERQLCSYWALNDYIELWCDFKAFDAPKDDLEVGKRKFRRNWIDEKPTAAYKHLGFPLVDEFQKTGMQIHPFVSSDFYQQISTAFGVEKPDAVEIALRMTDDEYCDNISDRVFDSVVSDLVYYGTDFISKDVDIGSEGIDELYVVDSALLDAERIGREGGLIIYKFIFFVTLEGTSYDYWGRDDDTKEIITSPGIDHTFEGTIEIEVTRVADIFLDFEDDNEFESAEITKGCLEETQRIDHFLEDYEEEVSEYEICPEGIL